MNPEAIRALIRFARRALIMEQLANGSELHEPTLEELAAATHLSTEEVRAVLVEIKAEDGPADWSHA